MAGNGERTTAMLSKKQINLKLIPGVDGHAEICQLVAYNIPASRSKAPGSVRAACTSFRTAPVADFPVRKVLGAHHVTLPYGRVLWDHNKKSIEPSVLRRPLVAAAGA